MANVAFTKDEAILALDVLLSSGQKRLKPDCKEIVELSKLLNELPIIPQEQRGEIFRNCHGIAHQLDMFCSTFSQGTKGCHVGAIFYQVAEEFANKSNELHSIANAIKRNKDYFQGFAFGNDTEIYSFPEGALLSHLHRLIEQRDGSKVIHAASCEICRLDLSEVYRDIPGNFMQLHLTVPITELDSRKKYKPDDFIIVCPNCHAVIHQIRPWISKENAGEILK